jgi:hypothetical protein
MAVFFVKDTKEKVICFWAGVFIGTIVAQEEQNVCRTCYTYEATSPGGATCL